MSKPVGKQFDTKNESVNLVLTVYAATPEKEKAWATQLESHVKALEVPVSVISGTRESIQSQMVFVDAEIKDLKSVLFGLNRRGNAVFLVLSEEAPLPKNLEGMYVDDIIVAPFRAAEVESKVRFYKQLILWNEVTELNATLSDVLKHLQSDLQLASRIHQIKMPRRFPKVKGFEVNHRYLAGVRPGGDHFDLAETVDGSCLSLVYFHSTSYGLSGAILSILMKTAVKLSQFRMGTPGASVEIVQAVYDEILMTMSPRDQVSLFFGIYSRKDQMLRFVNLGNACASFGLPGAPMEILPVHGSAISRSSTSIGFKEGQIKVTPGSRFALTSEGFVNGAQGPQNLLALLNQTRLQESTVALNELTWRVKSKLLSTASANGLGDETELPPQDCTGVILDAGRTGIQLAE